LRNENCHSQLAHVVLILLLITVHVLNTTHTDDGKTPFFFLWIFVFEDYVSDNGC
jgi:hypothetical protein